MLLKRERVSFKIGINVLSISTAMTLYAFSARAEVNVPIPGPISITTSFSLISADVIILFKT